MPMEGVILNGQAPRAEASEAPSTTATSTGATLSSSAGDEISADEVALYDRQIRLWGMEAQTRMRDAHILLVTIRALGNEIAKNLVLAGIGAITVVDTEMVTEEDLGAQFCVDEGMVGMNRAEAAAPAIQKLNPRVAVTTDSQPIETRDAEYFRQFSIVIVTEADLNTLISVNESCREAGVAFYAGACFGLYGYAFADLIKHQFIIERDKGNMETKIGSETRTRRIVSATTKKEAGGNVKEFVTKEEVYSPIAQVVASQIDRTWRPKKKKGVAAALPAIFALWKFHQSVGRLPDPYAHPEDTKTFMAAMHEARNGLGLPLENVDPGFALTFLDSVGTELSPVAAVLGGMLAQGVINYLGKREQPLQNVMVFDGDTTAAPIYCLHPQDEINLATPQTRRSAQGPKSAADGSHVTRSQLHATQPPPLLHRHLLSSSPTPPPPPSVSPTSPHPSPAVYGFRPASLDTFLADDDAPPPYLPPAAPSRPLRRRRRRPLDRHGSGCHDQSSLADPPALSPALPSPAVLRAGVGFHIGVGEHDRNADAPASPLQRPARVLLPPKKRRIEEYEHPQAATKPLRLMLAYCDGGTYEAEKYRVSNMLADDESVYCTERYSCNLVLQHETRQPFTLEWLEVKAPPHGFTSPVSEGIVAVTDDDYNTVVEKIALYGRMVPLKKRARLVAIDDNENGDDDGDVEIRYRVLRDDDDDELLEGEVDDDERREDDDENEQEQEEEGGDEYYLDGERVTEFDVRREDADEEDKDEEEEAIDGAAGEGQRAEGSVQDAGAATDDAPGQPQGDIAANDRDGDAATAGLRPWPPLGSRRIPRTTGLELEDNNPHDCPYDLPGEDDTEMEVAVWESDEDSAEEELRLWLRRNSGTERRRRRQRREEEEEAEREYAQSEADNEETYVRFQLRDNKTFIVFDPPRYCRSIVLKLWGAKIDNVDIQAVLGYGYFGKRAFPAVEMR
ncbi:hypothetical protein Dda_1016 [Drechslerella dactyloides]|uniref:THIF-type NAD/FAD binding fold domain-containing protein n=1 Tax=Drechslerella dactyloides TaxID=74499 RepID=A0AAD6NPF8_DREDA|nr:hypothetical protein Dda_1016 [Drechslerella dactyloides]